MISEPFFKQSGSKVAQNRPKPKGLTLLFRSILGTCSDGVKPARNHFKVKANLFKG